MKRFAETTHPDHAATELHGINKPPPVGRALVKIISAVLLLYALTLGISFAAVITFDDLWLPGIGGNAVPNGYKALTWVNAFYLNSANNNLGGGYNRAAVSRPNVAFMGDDLRPVLVSGPAFTFNSAWLTAAWKDGLNIRVRGYSDGANGTLLYDRIVIVNTSGPIFFTFNYVGIDTLRFDTSGGVGAFPNPGGHFVIDDMSISFPGEPTVQNLSVVAAANHATSFVVTGSDPNGDSLTYRIVSPPSHGIVSLSTATPTASYTPDPDYVGSDSFDYLVNDGRFDSTSARVSITVKHGLLINNISVTEGDSGTKAANFSVTMTPPGTFSGPSVSVRYRTSDGSARAGSDYFTSSGALVFSSNESIETINVPVIGDRTVEFNESFLVTLFDASDNALIVNGTGRGTILNDDSVTLSRVGTAGLSPENSVVSVGEPVNLSLSWTHPVGWRRLDSVDLLLVDDEGEILTRWHEAENSFSLFSPAADRFVRTAGAGSPARFESSVATLYLRESTGGGPPGQIVTIDYSLSFKPHAAGRKFSVEAFATDDAGNQQGFESVGTITVLPH